MPLPLFLRNDGWDRTVVRASFVRFYNELVLPNVDQVASTPRKVRSREQARHRNPPLFAPEDQPRPKSGDKRVPTVHLQNARTGLLQYYAEQNTVVTNRDLIKRRYEDKLDWYNKHFVSFSLNFSVRNHPLFMSLSVFLGCHSGRS